MNLANPVLGNAATWALLVGALMPLLIQHLTNFTRNQTYQTVIAGVACLAAGAGTAYFTGQLTGKSLTAAALAVYLSAQVAYEQWWKGIGVTPSTTLPATPSATAQLVALGDSGAALNPPGGVPAGDPAQPGAEDAQPAIPIAAEQVAAEVPEQQPAEAPAQTEDHVGE